MLLNLMFEDELQNLTDLQKNLLNGAITGGLFSSTRGLIPFFVGSATGATTVFLLHHAVNWLYENQYIHFDMRF